MVIWTCMFVAAVVWTALFLLNRRAVRRHDGVGDAREGILLFVEPVRWLFIIWGFAPFCRGLRSAGWRGQTRLFRWSSSAGALLVIPDVVRRPRLIRRADRLAALIQKLAIERPEAPIYLCGYSSGCYIAIEALARHRGNQVRHTLLLAGTISPNYPLDGIRRGTGRLHHVYSPIDVINLVGPLLIGTNDRCWMPACGSLGFRAGRRVIAQRRWRFRDLRQLYFGDHFSIVSPRFVREHLAPWFCGHERVRIQETAS